MRWIRSVLTFSCCQLSEKNGAVNRGFGGDTLNTSVYIARQTDASALSVHYVTALGT
ncbi:hypothetical protein ACSLOS_31870, partial [Klebsiella pneumoniae]